MNTVDKMLIKGIRSFNPENKNVVTFFRPLTLIVGANRAGKTTIIECLKVSCTGELPPNARYGHNFIHDPKVAGETETKAQIKLRFKTAAGKDVVCIRSFQLTQKASKMEYKAIESVLQTINPHTGEKVCLSYRCADMDREIPALMDVQKFYHQCDPEKENLCLYGLPNETWEVNLPVEEVPPELPEPALGINFARDGMQEKDWISLVAVHSDSWLISVAFYFGARFGFGKNERKRLFQMINDLPTIFEVVSGNAKQSKDQSANHNSSRSKSSVGKPRHSESHPKASKMSPPPREEDESGDEEEDEEQGAVCGACGDNYGGDEFWICCDACEKWFHGKCVKITPAKAEHIKHYKCPSCSTNKKIKA